VPRTGEEETPVPTPATPAQVTPADFQSLRWLEGHWRGTGGGVPPFYEAYRFVDDSTIQALMFADSTLAQVSDSGRIVLSQGVLTSRGENSVSVVTEIDSNHVHFAPQENAGNEFTWTRETPTAWTAVLSWTDQGGEARERVYRMQRIEAPVP
jgi:hypothetical protein